MSPASISPDELRGAGAESRRALIPLRSTAEAAMLEPVGHVDRTSLMEALVAAERIDANLLALAAYAQYLNRSELAGLIDPQRADSVLEEFDRAGQACDLQPPARVASQSGEGPTPPDTAERRALIVQVDQLGENAAALGQAVEQFCTGQRQLAG